MNERLFIFTEEEVVILRSALDYTKMNIDRLIKKHEKYIDMSIHKEASEAAQELLTKIEQGQNNID